jgi:superfamily II DNA/RNA helicase
MVTGNQLLKRRRCGNFQYCVTFQLIQKFGKFTELSVMTFVGGTPYKEAIHELRNRNDHVISATVGRLYDGLIGFGVNSKETAAMKEVYSLNTADIIVVRRLDMLIHVGFMDIFNEIIKMAREDTQWIISTDEVLPEVLDVKKRIKNCSLLEMKVT